MKHIIRLHFFFWLSLLGLALSPLSIAASYKWTDSKGNVHYSQYPPKGKSYEKIKTPKHRHSSAPPPKSSSAASSTGSIPSESGENDADQILLQEKASNAEIRKKNCEAHKQNLKAYSVYRRIKDPDGNIRVISDKERAEQRKQAEQGIKEFCD